MAVAPCPRRSVNRRYMSSSRRVGAVVTPVFGAKASFSVLLCPGMLTGILVPWAEVFFHSTFQNRFVQKCLRRESNACVFFHNVFGFRRLATLLLLRRWCLCHQNAGRLVVSFHLTNIPFHPWNIPDQHPFSTSWTTWKIDFTWFHNLPLLEFEGT